MTLLIAGHETSAAVLTWTFYLLAQNPAATAKLQKEVDSVLGDKLPNTEDMKNLKYTTRVINESLRLYPQPPVLIRRSLESDVLGKYPIKKGEDIFISLWNLHRSPHLWENPEDFNPERWPLDQPAPNEVNQDYRYLPLPFILNSSGHVWAFVESFSFCQSNYDVVWWDTGRYLPFGGGQRKCLGDMFATFEVCNFRLAVMSLRHE
jgi:beta-ring hydroxylase